MSANQPIQSPRIAPNERTPHSRDKVDPQRSTQYRYATNRLASNGVPRHTDCDDERHTHDTTIPEERNLNYSDRWKGFRSQYRERGLSAKQRVVTRYVEPTPVTLTDEQRRTKLHEINGPLILNERNAPNTVIHESSINE